MRPTTNSIFLAILLFLSFSASHNLMAQKSTIQFFEGSWSEALTQAQAENKLIFVDAYTSWCGPCKLMAKQVFTDKKVGKFYNQNFINVKLDVEKGEGIDFGSNYNIKAVPALLYVNGDGEVVREYSGYQAASCFLQMGQKVQTLSTVLIAP